MNCWYKRVLGCDIALGLLHVQISHFQTHGCAPCCTGPHMQENNEANWQKTTEKKLLSKA